MASKDSKNALLEPLATETSPIVTVIPEGAPRQVETNIYRDLLRDLSYQQPPQKKYNFQKLQAAIFLIVAAIFLIALLCLTIVSLCVVILGLGFMILSPFLGHSTSEAMTGLLAAVTGVITGFGSFYLVLKAIPLLERATDKWEQTR